MNSSSDALPQQERIPVESGISTRPQALRKSVEGALEHYFAQLDGQHTTELYQLVMQEVEVPLFKSVLDYTGNNQSRAAEILGLNRGTLRKKLKQYDLL